MSDRAAIDCMMLAWRLTNHKQRAFHDWSARQTVFIFMKEQN